MGNSKKLFLVSISLILICGCITGGEEVEKLNFEKRIPIQNPSDSNEIEIAVSGVISPKETFIYYEELLIYLSGELGRPIKLVQRDTYEEVNELVRTEKIDVAFVCSGAYVDGHEKFGMELLVAPVTTYGESVYYSYLIVNRDSKITTVEGLRGKDFAFTDPLSNSGRLAPTYILSQMGETPGNFFNKTIFTYNHDKSIEAVVDGFVDGAAVDSLIWEYLDDTNPELTSKTVIIEKSEPFGIPPIVVSRSLEPKFKEELKLILLNMHKDEKGSEILEKIKIDRFAEIEDSAYDSIRKMK